MGKERSERAQPLPAPPPRYRAEDLLAGTDRAEIVLGGQVYTLRLTRTGKLILTK